MNDAAAESIKARLVATAALEIRQIGVRRMSVSGIAARLGMSHANVYHYFSDRAALIEAVLNGLLRPLEQRLQDIVESPDPADDKLERFLTTLSRSYSDALANESAVFCLINETVVVREATRHRRRIDTWLERIAEEGIVTRLFTAPDVRRLTQLISDVTTRFCDPRVVILFSSEPMTEVRRDRIIRSVVRILAHR